MKRRLDMERLSPAGYNMRMELKYFAGGLIVSFVYSLNYVFRFLSARRSLYYYLRTTGEWVLREGAVMKDFAALLGSSLLLFRVLALCMALTAALHYAYHRRGSRSDYLMRRLPDRWEMHRRCLTIPVCTALISLTAWFALLLIYYGLYMLATPGQCLAPGQWAKLWTMEVRA